MNPLNTTRIWCSNGEWINRVLREGLTWNLQDTGWAFYSLPGCGMKRNLKPGCRIARGKWEAWSWLFSLQDTGIIYFFVWKTGCKTVKIRIQIDGKNLRNRNYIPGYKDDRFFFSASHLLHCSQINPIYGTGYCTRTLTLVVPHRIQPTTCLILSQKLCFWYFCEIIMSVMRTLCSGHL